MLHNCDGLILVLWPVLVASSWFEEFHTDVAYELFYALCTGNSASILLKIYCLVDFIAGFYVSAARTLFTGTFYAFYHLDPEVIIVVSGFTEHFLRHVIIILLFSYGWYWYMGRSHSRLRIMWLFSFLFTSASHRFIMRQAEEILYGRGLEISPLERLIATSLLLLPLAVALGPHHCFLLTWNIAVCLRNVLLSVFWEECGAQEFGHVFLEDNANGYATVKITVFLALLFVVLFGRYIDQYLLPGNGNALLLLQPPFNGPSSNFEYYREMYTHGRSVCYAYEPLGP